MTDAPPDPTRRAGGDETPAARAGLRLAEVEELSGIGSWEWDTGSNELFWSEQLCRVYGVEPDPAPRTYEEFIACVHPDDRDLLSATVGDALERRAAFTTEHRVVHRDGSVHVIAGRGRVLTDESGSPIRMLGSARDVTEERRAAEESAAEDRRRIAGQARDDALALLAHDLRSPLAVVVGYVQLLQRQVEMDRFDPERIGPYLQRIGVAARQMTSLLDDLLTDASPDAASEPVEMMAVDLTSWLRDRVEHLEATIGTHTIRTELPETEVPVEVNSPKLERAVANLVTNAVKYSPEGSTVTLALLPGPEGICIAVRDEGIGIPADDLPRIFDRFHRGANVTGRVGGLGLGLTSVVRAVEAHRGSVAVDSVEGEGTTFTITLPRRR
jgi:PAS domain S-box-containing protein